jgi:hypothetical protein
MKWKTVENGEQEYPRAPRSSMPPRKRNTNAHLESAEQILREAQVLRTRLATQLATPHAVPLFVPHRPLEALPELAEAEAAWIHSSELRQQYMHEAPTHASATTPLSTIIDAARKQPRDSTRELTKQQAFCDKYGVGKIAAGSQLGRNMWKRAVCPPPPPRAWDDSFRPSSRRPLSRPNTARSHIAQPSLSPLHSPRAQRPSTARGSVNPAGSSIGPSMRAALTAAPAAAPAPPALTAAPAAAPAPPALTVAPAAAPAPPALTVAPAPPPPTVSSIPERSVAQPTGRSMAPSSSPSRLPPVPREPILGRDSILGREPSVQLSEPPAPQLVYEEVVKSATWQRPGSGAHLRPGSAVRPWSSRGRRGSPELLEPDAPPNPWVP